MTDLNAPENGLGLRRIQVRGVGRDVRPPDLAVVSVGVETRAVAAGAALAANNIATAAVLSVLRAHGIDARDLQTSQISVHPDHDHQTGRSIGYVVSNQLSVKIRSIGSASSVLDAVASAGGDAIRIHGLSFELADRSQAERAARSAAVADARDQAEQMSAAAGVELGPLLGISTVTHPEGGFPRPMFSVRGAAMDTVAIEGGSIDVVVEVDLVYSLR